MSDTIICFSNLLKRTATVLTVSLVLNCQLPSNSPHRNLWDIGSSSRKQGYIKCRLWHQSRFIILVLPPSQRSGFLYYGVKYHIFRPISVLRNDNSKSWSTQSWLVEEIHLNILITTACRRCLCSSTTKLIKIFRCYGCIAVSLLLP